MTIYIAGPHVRVAPRDCSAHRNSWNTRSSGR